MNYQISFRKEAEFDVDDARIYYDACVPGLGLDFLSLLEQTIKRILLNPLQFPIVHRHVRRAIVYRFSYSVLFTIDDRKIIIHAVLHPRRNLAPFLH